MEGIIYQEKPVLSQPTLIIGLDGWPNAAEVSSYGLQQLIEATGAKKFAFMDGEEFYQMTSHRPVAVIKEGRLVEIRPVGNYFYYARGGSSGDLILFHGVEPHLRWGAFVERLFSLVEAFGIVQLITLGGTYDYVPHTYPPKVSALFNQEDVKKSILKAGLELADHTGPVSVHALILEAARKRGIQGLSLWGHAPHYLQGRNVKVVYGILKKLNDLLEADIDLSDLQRASDYFDEQVHQLVKQDPKLQEIMRKLEEVYQNAEEFSSLPGKTEGAKEEKVIYIQAFLKKTGDEEKKGG